jgi:membrane-bound lytic murein transglycosylase MltF
MPRPTTCLLLSPGACPGGKQLQPKARGRNGEIGLLQIKPQTARAMGYKGSAKDLYDPQTNWPSG